MRLQRIKLTLAFLLFVAAAVIAGGFGVGMNHSRATSLFADDERKLESLIPKHVPISIRIKKEKEKDFKDLNNADWAKSFELEVTNTGTKPIYAFYLLMVLDVKSAKGYDIVAPIYYGRNELNDINGRPTPEDIPIQPGASTFCSIHPSQIVWWNKARVEEHRQLPTKLQVKLEFLSFGDGTAFMGNEGVELPRKVPGLSKSHGPPKLITGEAVSLDVKEGKRTSLKRDFYLPAGTSPVNFFVQDSGNLEAAVIQITHDKRLHAERV